jgi:ribosomal protein L35
MLAMRKTVLKRIKITKTGKILRRRAGHNHFNAKARRTVQYRQKRMTKLAGSMEKKIKNLMRV